MVASPKALVKHTVRVAALFFGFGMILPALACYDTRSRALTYKQEMAAVALGMTALLLLALPLYLVDLLEVDDFD